MESFVELFSNLFQNFLMIWFISDFCGYKYKGLKKILGFAVILITGFTIITVINYYTDYDGLLSIITVICFVIYAQVCLKDSIAIHIFSSLFSMVIVFTIASLLFFVTANISGGDAGALLTEFSGTRLFVLCLCRGTEFLVFKVILYLRKEYNLTYKEWILFIIVLFATWMEVMLFTKATILASEITGYMTGASVVAVIVNALIYYFIIYVNRAMQAKTELTLVKMQYDNVKTTEKNMKVLYDSTYSIKHDLEKHFLYLRTLEEKGKGTEIIEYIDNILGEELNKSHKIVFTNNDIFNALMNIRLEICHQKNIKPSINIESTSVDGIKSEDVMILFGNIFDNAIEAAEKTEERIIILNVRTQGDYISIYMENSFDGVFDSELKTKKKNKNEHGIGLKNVRRIVEKYDGMIKCFADNKMFCCDILLKK